MKIFLIYLRDENFFHILSGENNKPESGEKVKVMAFPPLGIQTLAPILRMHGHDVRMFDTCHPKMKAQHIAVAAKEESPDVIAISSLSTTTYPSLKSMAEVFKKSVPDIPIIVGGVFATINAVKILQDCSFIDFIGAGEGEELLPDFLNNLNDPGVVGNLTWRKNGEVIQNPVRPLIKDLDKYPYPDRTSLPIEYIESMPLDVPAVLSLDKFCIMQTSRGCPYTCIYCDIPTLSGGKWRFRSAGHVLGELEELNNAGYKSIYFTDDHFLLKRERIQEICNGIIERKFDFHWGCEGRVDSVAVEELPIMAKANCSFLAFGVEAGTQKVLNRLQKRQTLDQIKHAVGEAKRHGIETAHGFFLIGSPDETVDDILESFRFAARLKLDTFGFNRLCVYRGTPLWNEYLEKGIIDDDKDWHKWFKCSDIDPDILPSEVLNETRKKGYMLLFRYRILRRPIKTFKLILKFSRFMKFSNVMKLLMSPFKKRTLTREPELPAVMIEQGLKSPVRAAN
jgi:radical SAM superfamily enzyme YgiQ (UPF0313 family)